MEKRTPPPPTPQLAGWLAGWLAGSGGLQHPWPASRLPRGVPQFI